MPFRPVRILFLIQLRNIGEIGYSFFFEKPINKHIFENRNHFTSCSGLPANAGLIALSFLLPK
jgi:hypothetical protein